MFDPSTMMRDPSTAKNRIYVGSLADTVTKTDFEEAFSKYGAVLGSMQNRGFGFIQFEKEESVAEAIRDSNGVNFHGRKLLVKNAMSGGGGIGGGVGGGGFGMGGNGGGCGLGIGGGLSGGVGGGIGGGSGGGLGGGGGNSLGNNRGNNEGRGGRGGRSRRGHSSHSTPFNDRDRSPHENMIHNRDQNNERWPGNDKQTFFGGNNDQPNFFVGSNDNMPMSGGPIGQIPFNMPQPLREPDKNDCEIIVVSRNLTSYAESVEARLKRLGMFVDLLFPNEDVPIGKVLANIASRGCLYAILVTPQNEEHRSITVNILYGQPAEHRNMPVDDAINFISVHFQEKQRIEKAKNNLSSMMNVGLTAPPLKERHPEAIQMLVNLLADNRALTALQYERIIKYLSERRELQLKVEIGDPSELDHSLIGGVGSIGGDGGGVAAGNPMPCAPARNPEFELQQKILNILHRPSITNASIPDVVLPSAMLQQSNNLQSASGSNNDLLQDPKVQQALDSLLQGKMMGGGVAGFKF